MFNGSKIYFNIKKEMGRQGLNQTDIAKIIGVTRSNISIIFSRMKQDKISYKNIMKIAKVLNCDPKIFFK